MKKMLLLLVVLFAVVQITTVYSQTVTYTPWVSAVKGDTLVVKTQDEMMGDVNALYNVIRADTINPPAGRVYQLKAGGVYPAVNNPRGYANRTTRIVGSDPTMLVQNKNAANSLPLIVGYCGTHSNPGGLGSSGDMEVRNCAMTPTAPDGCINWAFINATTANQRLTWDNCLFERTRWVIFQVSSAGVSEFIKNCYFVNLIGQPCRRNGGVYDGFAKLDTMWVENSTHIMTQGFLYKWRNYTAKRINMNHNTFVNCAGSVFMDLGTQTKVNYTNNLFVNVNVQPFPAIASIDDGEKDIDLQPMGIVNVYPDSALEATATPRKFLVEGNAMYTSPYLANVTDTANTMKINGKTTWSSQAIWMNTRTTAMFANDYKYPWLGFGVNYTNENPNFTNPRDLFGTQLVELKKFSLATVDTGIVGQRAVLPAWRLVNTGVANFCFYDWPIPVDLSYSSTKLLTGATGQFPVGDLNWFPAKKIKWLAQRTAEYVAIENALSNGIVCEYCEDPNAVNDDHSFLPLEFHLEQNYPNPFNPSTAISYQLSAISNVTLKVFDVLGREVQTLVNERQNAGRHTVMFNATNLPSGVYFYRLTAPGFNQVKKMLLMK